MEQQLKAKKSIFKKWWFWVFIAPVAFFFLIIILVAIFNPRSFEEQARKRAEEEKLKQKTEQKQENKEVDTTEKKKEFTIKERIHKEIESIKTFDGSTYRGDLTSLQLEIVIFSTWAKLVEEGRNSDVKETQELAKDLKKLVSKIQIKEFPILRKEYYRIIKAKLWENDIKVKLKGKQNTTLEFVGGIFAANKNKQEMQETISEILHQFRFKRVNYKWYKYDDEYTYYSVNSLSDKELSKDF